MLWSSCRRPSQRPTRPVVLGAAASAILVGVVFAASGTALSSARARQAAVGAATRSFVSLVPACACGRHTVLAAFSLRDGRRLRTITTVRTVTGEFVAISGGPSGEVLEIASTPAKCSSDVAGCGPVPDTCSTQVSRLVGRRFVPLFTEPASVFIEVAIASPDRRRVAMLAGPCAEGATHVVVRDLATGRQWSIGKDLSRCTGLGAPAWSATGRKLVMPYGSLPKPHRLGPLGTCPVPHYAKLAIVPAPHASRSGSWKLIAHDPGCSFEAATFDPAGIAAVEGCRRKGVSESYVNPGFGQARLLEINRVGHVTVRINLEPGWEEGAITTERSGRVLISQDQPANEPYPERDWVWEFDGRHLRLVHHYKAEDAAEIIAIPYR